ncbi:hypothetical protein MOX02_34300 [Methylobacterium oxalidis]|uniref:Uncharacterized protein n=1 Tax=Methylobacterium oxalidis TaxID=944322 RepID=A0A512J669_9HYPH|nr:hypothetical protein MOX02_34300 [Methylobacterium oxalidis]GLS66282.1 hypothetical protein GCM10007888_46640 [Methylobacterium oxalidis]
MQALHKVQRLEVGAARNGGVGSGGFDNLDGLGLHRVPHPIVLPVAARSGAAYGHNVWLGNERRFKRQDEFAIYFSR